MANQRKEFVKRVVKIPKADFIKEHVHLKKVLRTGRGMKKELADQSQELKKITG